jgi:hypothetical protein
MSWKLAHTDWDRCYFCKAEDNGKNMRIMGGKYTWGMLINCCDKCQYYCPEFFMKIYPEYLREE